MKTHKEIIIPGLIISRGLIEPDIVEQLDGEFRQMWAEWGAGYHGIGSEAQTVESIGENIGRVTLETLDVLNIYPTAQFSVNRYEPMQTPDFHEDGVALLAIQGLERGVLDYAPGALDHEQARQKHKSVGVNPGDVTWNTLPGLIHRGRNISATVRYNAVVTVGKS